MPEEDDNPFTPGPGIPPPLRVGHAGVLDEVSVRLKKIANRKYGDMMVLYGPRGNGKTTLLLEIERVARKAGIEVRKRSADRFEESTEAIALSLQHDDDPQPEVTKSAQVNVSIAQAGAQVKHTHHSAIVGVLRHLAKSKPVVLIVDEAHMLPVDTGRALLNGAQTCIGEGLPLLIVLAGTPGIRQKFRKMGASFWERSNRLRVGRLESDDEVRQALAIPAKESGLPFDEDALDLLVPECQRYPFFVQVLGNRAWKASQRASHARITLEDAKAGLSSAEEARLDFYEERREEVDDQGMFDEAKAVSEAIAALGDEPVLTERMLDRILADATSGSDKSPKQVKDKLASLGLIWKAAPNRWEPGIPSLCRYLSGL